MCRCESYVMDVAATTTASLDVAATTTASLDAAATTTAFLHDAATTAFCDGEEDEAGQVEIEAFCGLESSLHENMTNCQKYQDHKEFIPVNKFNIGHLPERYQDNDLVDLILALAALTVRIKVGKLSPERPKVRYPPIPRYDKHGRERSITGSGWVARVDTYSDGKVCSCRECSNSPTACKQWGRVEIFTVTHVVYDQFEAQHTVCHLGYDSDGADLKTLPALRDVGGIQSDRREDLTHLLCYTHDMELLDKLHKSMDKYRQLQRPVMDKYLDGSKSEEDLSVVNKFLDGSESEEDLSVVDKYLVGSEIEEDLTVVVSHPHGCSKHVTVGELRECHFKDDEGDLGQYKYTTPTCPGSSGGPVFILGRGLWYDEHPHSGTKAGLNHGAVFYA